MKKNLTAILPLMLCSSIAIGEEYHSFTDLDYTRTETNFFEFDTFTIGSTWYFGPKESVGPFKEFEYVNTTSNVFGSWSQVDTPGDDFNQASIGGEYFTGNLLLGGSYHDGEGSDAFIGTVGYLFSDNFLVSVDAAKADGSDTQYSFNARYNHQLAGTDYIGFSVSADDDFFSKQISSKYFTRLAGDHYLAAEATYTFIDDTDDLWAVEGDYYFSERTSLGLGIQKSDIYTVDFTHFFNENVAVELVYTTMEEQSDLLDVDFNSYELGVTVQF